MDEGKNGSSENSKKFQAKQEINNIISAVLSMIYKTNVDIK